MKEHDSEDARTEAAVNLSLGLLEASESERLTEHLSSGCPDCNSEVLSFAQVAGAVGMSTTTVHPPASLRGRLLQAVASLSASGEAAEMSAWKIIRTASLPWKATRREGIWEKSLLHDPIRHRSTRVIRMDAGAMIPAHRHIGDEESLVLEGTGKLGDSNFEVGDYHRAPSGTVHPFYASDAGCVFLLFSGTEYEFLSERREQSSSSQFITIPARSGVWKAERPGLDSQTLFSPSKTSSETTTLFRLGAGHALNTSELSISEVYVLEGIASLGSTELCAGDYLQRIAPSPVGELRSQQQCRLLIRSGE